MLIWLRSKFTQLVTLLMLVGFTIGCIYFINEINVGFFKLHHQIAILKQENQHIFSDAKPYHIIWSKEDRFLITAPKATTNRQVTDTALQAVFTLHKRYPKKDRLIVMLLAPLSPMHKSSSHVNARQIMWISVHANFRQGKPSNMHTNLMLLPHSFGMGLIWFYRHHSNWPWVKQWSFKQWQTGTLILAHHSHLSRDRVLQLLRGMAFSPDPPCSMDQRSVACLIK